FWLRFAALLIILILPVIAYLVIKWRFRDPAFATAYRIQAPRMMIMQIVASGMAYLQYWLILNAFGVIGFFQNWMRMALTNFSNSIPITVAGLGLRESFAIHFLADAGFSAETAVSATLSLFLIQDVIPAIIGAGVLLKGKPKAD
ncbi:MAG TPA: lysylphosphatidylglycerol synthase domain-containing protein, partial [Candidatus Cloacimonadota bacterium]|nr:lysylphosphatidylglycerol synthase domain-containing protein [Candidatus Cloacimonadota bacterium]